MILLILFIIIFFDFGFRLFKFHYDSINSRKEFADKAEIGVFKFHYDSINSQRHPKIVAFGPQFKFHYDSINSLIGRRLSTKQLHLNSIMILLIHVNKICNALGYKYLNSIMILLIPVPKSSPYLSQKTSLFCRPLQNSTFLSCP